MLVSYMYSKGLGYSRTPSGKQVVLLPWLWEVQF